MGKIVAASGKTAEPQKVPSQPSVQGAEISPETSVSTAWLLGYGEQGLEVYPSTGYLPHPEPTGSPVPAWGTFSWRGRTLYGLCLTPF